MSISPSTEARPATAATLLAERLARTVCELDPNPRNAFAVTVLLEVLGYTDARAVQAGYADVFALAQDVFDQIEFLRVEEAPAAPSAREPVPDPRPASPLLAAVTQQIVWLIMVVLMVAWGRSVWSADHLPPSVAEAIIVGVLGSLILSGGFQYAISHRLNFHAAQHDTVQADAFLRQAQWLGTLVMVACAGVIAAGFRVLHPADEFGPLLAGGYFLLHGVYRIAVVPLIALNDVAGILLTTGGGVALFVLTAAHLSAAGTEPVRAVAIAQLAALAALWLGSLARTRTLVGGAAPVGVMPEPSLAGGRTARGTPQPRWPVVGVEAAPWFATGLLYYAFLFGTRPIGWMLPPSERVAYESGVDLGLLSIIPVAIAASWALHLYYRWLRERLATTGLHGMPGLRTEAVRRFAQAVSGCRLFGIAAGLALLALTAGQPWRGVPAQSFWVFRITVVCLTMALPGFLLSFGLLTSLRALGETAGLLVCGLVLQLAAGLGLVRMGTAGWLAVGFVGSALVLGELAVWRAHRFVREIDRFYYGAF